MTHLYVIYPINCSLILYHVVFMRSQIIRYSSQDQLQGGWRADNVADLLGADTESLKHAFHPRRKLLFFANEAHH